MASVAILAIAGFTALGSIFDYPKILKEPTEGILAVYRARPGRHQCLVPRARHQRRAAAPIGILLGRLAGGSAGRWIAGLGIAGAAVQAIGLSRWVVLVPHVGTDTFELLHTWLGEVLGETIGYALTAAFTLCVVRAIAAPRWLRATGYASAVLIATGVVIPIVEGFSLTNFAGYVLWCLWLIAMSVVLWRPAVASRKVSIA